MDDGYQTYDATQMSDALSNISFAEDLKESHEEGQNDDEKEETSDIVVEVKHADEDGREILPVMKVEILDARQSTENEMSDLVPVIKHEKPSSSDSSSDSEDGEIKKRKEYKKKLKEENKIVNAKLKEQISTTEHLRAQLQEEKDAKSQLELQISESEMKYRDQLKDMDTLRSQLNNKEEYCGNLKRKQETLDLEITELKTKITELEDLKKEEFSDENKSIGNSEFGSLSSVSSDEMERLNEKLNTELSELRYKFKSSEMLIKTYLSQIEKLDNENAVLKEKMKTHENTDGKQFADSEKQTMMKNVEEMVQTRLQDMESCLINQSQLQTRIKVLESENASLQDTLLEHQMKYAEALVTLKEVQDAYGEMRDNVLERYKQEVSVLQDKLRIAEESNNERVVTGLRQEILDSRLLLERTKQTHRNEMDYCRKKEEENEEKVKNVLKQMDGKNNETNEIKKSSDELQTKLNTMEETSNDRMQKIMELNRELIDLNDKMKVINKAVTEKQDEISELKDKLLKGAEMLEKQYYEKKILQKDVEEMESVRRRNNHLQEEVDELKHQMKLRGLKIKFVKKQMKDMQDQKQKIESIMFVLPEMQKKLDNLEEEKQNLRQELDARKKQEQERIQQIEQAKQDEEDRIQKEKENWELKFLGIGRCELYHEDDIECNEGLELNGSFNRPNSAPPMKPRPPSARRHNMNGSPRKMFNSRAQTLNPSYLNSYPEGRRANEKMKRHQEKVLFTSKKNNFFRTLEQRSQNSKNLYSHSSGSKHFPKIYSGSPSDINENLMPRVLVLGDSEEGPGKKLLAVGDHVVANILRDCSTHGKTEYEDTGYVKFIGFIDGNSEDVYIGLRLDHENGNSDGRVDGKRYFRSEPQKGKFIRLKDIVKVLESNAKHPSTLTI